MSTEEGKPEGRTCEQFELELRAALTRLQGSRSLPEFEIERGLEEFYGEPGETMLGSEEWDVFAPVSQALGYPGEPDVVFDWFLWLVGERSPEVEFHHDELWEVPQLLKDSGYSDDAVALAGTISHAYTIDWRDELPIRAAALYGDWGWALVRPDKLLRFASPLDLVEFLIQQGRT